MSKQGIIAAIRRGQLSATRNENKQYQIDPAELFRVYAPVSTGVKSDVELSGNEEPDQTAGLQAEVKMFRELVAAHEATIADLRQRLDQSQEQVTQLTAIVANLAPSPVQKRANWWQRLLGSGE